MKLNWKFYQGSSLLCNCFWDAISQKTTAGESTWVGAGGGGLAKIFCGQAMTLKK